MYFKSIIPQISQSTTEPCVICLEDIQNLSITPCGHLFCKDCISSAISNQHKCPVCRRELNVGQITEVLDETQKDEIETKHELKDLISRYGTKMAHLMSFLKEFIIKEGDNRAIVFSQWDPLLHQIGNTLDENGIKNVYVKGNVHQRNKAITTFKTEKDVKVIMLSLEHAASGINLTEASHIILMDPIAGTINEARAIEAQAIGRSVRQGQKRQVTVVRLIMQKTIEYEYFTRNTRPKNESGAQSVAATSGDSIRMVRTNSITTMLANNPELRKSGSLKDVMKKK